MLSLGVDAIENARTGILDWQVQDLGKICGALFQLTDLTKSHQ